MNKLLIVLFGIPILVSCKSASDSADAALYGSAMTGAVSYLAYSETKKLYQDSAISLSLPTDFYAEEITDDELSALMKQVSFDRTFPTVMAYMGNRDGYAFYQFKPSFESRRIVKVKRGAQDLDTLSTDNKQWKYVSPFYLTPREIGIGKSPSMERHRIDENKSLPDKK
jgi:hypothetical protein